MTIIPREISDKERLRQRRGVVDIENPHLYVPWIKTRDCYHGDGTRHVIPDLYYHNRQIHLMSDLEMQIYYMLRSNPMISEVFEQYPLLPISTTQNLSQQYNIRHPHNPKNGDDIVMTTDFLFIQTIGNKKQWVACAVKPAIKCENKRVKEKLFLEEQYWKERGIKWGVLTEQQVNETYVNNIILCKNGYREQTTDDVYEILKYMIIHKLILVDLNKEINLDKLLEQIQKGEVYFESNVYHEKRYLEYRTRLLEGISKAAR